MAPYVSKFPNAKQFSDFVGFHVRFVFCLAVGGYSVVAGGRTYECNVGDGWNATIVVEIIAFAVVSLVSVMYAIVLAYFIQTVAIEYLGQKAPSGAGVWKVGISVLVLCFIWSIVFVLQQFSYGQLGYTSEDSINVATYCP